MSPMRTYKWFWMTLGFWFLLSGMGAWAFIFGPFHLTSSKIAEFSTTINGSAQDNQILVSSTTMDLALDSLAKEWKEAGWKPLAQNSNIASLLMNTAKNFQSALNHLVQLRLYQHQD